MAAALYPPAVYYSQNFAQKNASPLKIKRLAFDIPFVTMQKNNYRRLLRQHMPLYDIFLV
jgi:hypothetical protein